MKKAIVETKPSPLTFGGEVNDMLHSTQPLTPFQWWTEAMADWIEEGEQAPDFSLTADNGEMVKLSALRGGPVVLYFYPKDDTPGCTREACAFRDRKAEITRLGATVLGISPDSVESHGEFRDKFSLNFALLADPHHRIAEKYGAWREKSMYGKKSMGIQRSTFLIDAAGRVARVWRSVKVDGHEGQVLSALAELADST